MVEHITPLCKTSHNFQYPQDKDQNPHTSQHGLFLVRISILAASAHTFILFTVLHVFLLFTP